MNGEPASEGLQEQLSAEACQQTMDPINEDIASSSLSRKSADLSLQIPPRPIVFGRSPSGKGIVQSQRSLRGSSTPEDFLRLSFKKAVLDGEGSSLLTPDTKEVPKSPILDSFFPTFSWKRSSSLPVSHAAGMSPKVSTPSPETSTEQHNSQKTTASHKVTRSLSVPVRNVVVVRSVSPDTHKEPAQTEPSDDHACTMEDGDEEIPEEEAVCRICLVSLCEGGKTFKLECSCKGDLRLTHEECVMKWFSIKGNKTCDVCGQEVSNLPVNLLRVRSSCQRHHRHERNRVNFVPSSISAWHDLVVLILISSISYFFIIEQLVVGDLDSKAVLIAAPFSFVLGLTGSTLSIVVAIKEYIWTYAALEFALVSMMSHLFYVVVHLPAVYAITVGALLGFGIALSINFLYLYLNSCGARATERANNGNQV